MCSCLVQSLRIDECVAVLLSAQHDTLESSVAQPAMLLVYLTRGFFSPVCIVDFVDFLLCIPNTQQSAVLIIVSQEYRKPEKPGELHPGAKKKHASTPSQASADSGLIEKYDYKNHPRYVHAQVTVVFQFVCVCVQG